MVWGNVSQNSLISEIWPCAAVIICIPVHVQMFLGHFEMLNVDVENTKIKQKQSKPN